MLKVRIASMTQNPEYIVCTYASLSRDGTPIDELHKKTLAMPIEKVRARNRRVIFDLGHASVAEHAVFNLDISGISRLAVEELEHARLCSYTEKSQRYQKIGAGEWTNPISWYDFPELHVEFADLMNVQEHAYEQLAALLCEQGLPVGRVREDARYALGLATHAQLGMTLNARNATYLMQRLYASSLLECRKLAWQIHKAIRDVAPSLVPERPRATEFLLRLDRTRQAQAKEMHTHGAFVGAACEPCWIPDHEKHVLAGLLYEKLPTPYVTCSGYSACCTAAKKRELAKEVLLHLEKHDLPPRSWELADVIFDVIISASCFAQLKRHRMCTIIPKRYISDGWCYVPQTIKSLPAALEILERVVRESSTMYAKIADEKFLGPMVAEYALTNAHTRQVLVKMNLRELYAFCKLRCDKHAQTEIRELATMLMNRVQARYPATCELLCGLDTFEEVKAAYLNSDFANMDMEDDINDKG